MKLVFVTIPVTLLFTLISACGQTFVDVGRNRIPPIPDGGTVNDEMSESENGEPEIVEEEVTESGEGDLSLPVYERQVKCTARAGTLPTVFATFCEQWEASLLEYFPTAHQRLCEQGDFVFLTQEHCAWTGQGEASKHIRVADRTSFSDAGTNFYYLGSYTYRLPFHRPGTGPSEMMNLAYGNPRGFVEAGYSLPASSQITPDGDATTLPDGRLQYHYRYEMRGMRKIGFHAIVISGDLAPGISAALNVATDELVGLNSKRTLGFTFALPDGSFHGISIEEREVPDRGLHDVAYKALKEMDESFMKTIRQNAEVK